MELSSAAVGRALDRLVATDLSAFLPRQRWFGSKGRRLTFVTLLDAAPIAGSPLDPWLSLVEVSFDSGPREFYFVPLAIRQGEGEPNTIVGRLELTGPPLHVFDAFEDEGFRLQILTRIEEGATLPSRRGAFTFSRTGLFPVIRAPAVRSSRRVTSEQSNTSVIYDDIVILKALRKIQPGVNPDREITAFLTTRMKFRNLPLLAGAIDYSGAGDLEANLGMLQHFIPNKGDGWTYTLDHLKQFYAFAASRRDDEDAGRWPQRIREFSAPFFLSLRHLGTLTARLHVALASDPTDPAFAPEQISAEDIRGWATDVGHKVSTSLDEVRQRLEALPERVQDDARTILDREADLIRQVGDLEILRRDRCVKTRTHGDYHLGQTLWTGEDFFILDFEGEPARSLTERRAKSSPLKDLAGMLRSFDYAAVATLGDWFSSTPTQMGHLEACGQLWAEIAAEIFLQDYLAEIATGPVRLVPSSRQGLERALAVYELDKACYELRYEINNRPAWLPIPLRGLVRILNRGGTGR